MKACVAQRSLEMKGERQLTRDKWEIILSRCFQGCPVTSLLISPIPRNSETVQPLSSKNLFLEISRQKTATQPNLELILYQNQSQTIRKFRRRRKNVFIVIYVCEEKCEDRVFF